MKITLTIPFQSGYAGLVAEKEATGIGNPEWSGEQPRCNDAAFLSPKVCPVSADRAGGAARLAGAPSVFPTPVSVCPLIGNEGGGKQTATGASQMNALTFRSTSFDIIDRNGQPWLKSGQIAEALGYADEKAVNKIYARNSDEFSDLMSQTVKLTVKDLGGQSDLAGSVNLTEQAREVRIFSMRGAHMIGMKAKTEAAKEFRSWVLDVLEGKTDLQKNQSNAALISAEQAGELATKIADKFPEGKSRPYAWSRFNNHFRIARYRELPARRFAEALAYIETMQAKALPAPETEAINLALAGIPKGSALIVTQPEPGSVLIKALPQDAVIVREQDLPKLIAEQAAISKSLLPSIIQAAAGRLA